MLEQKASNQMTVSKLKTIVFQLRSPLSLWTKNASMLSRISMKNLIKSQDNQSLDRLMRV
jgi:hypothetical protein